MSITVPGGSDVAALNPRIDELEQAMLAAPEFLIDLPLLHHFTPGLYIRQIFIPAGTLCTSRIHRTEHPFTVLRGKVSVFIPGGGVEHIEAPYFGITKAGTRRVLLVHEDVVWITYHTNPDDGQDIDAIERRIIERRELEDGKTSFELYHAALVGKEMIDSMSARLSDGAEGEVTS